MVNYDVDGYLIIKKYRCSTITTLVINDFCFNRKLNSVGDNIISKTKGKKERYE